jgi:hypothetical protein
MTRLYVSGNAVDQNQIPVVGAQIYVFAGGVLATLEDAGGAPLVNPLLAGADGFFEGFSVSPGIHVLRYVWGGKTRREDTLGEVSLIGIVNDTEQNRIGAEAAEEGAIAARLGAEAARDLALAYGSAAIYDTWTALTAVTGTAGDIAQVVSSDTGTHTDPVVGGTVPNSGVFRYSASPAGWERIAALESSVSQAFSAAAAQSALDATTNGAVQVALAEAAATQAQAAAVDANLAVNGSFFGSVAGPRENGTAATSIACGQVRLTGTGADIGGTGGTSAAWWFGNSAIYIEIEQDRELADGRNFRQMIFGTDSTTTAIRSLLLRYSTRVHGTSGDRGTWYLRIRGEGGGGFAAASIIATVPAMPADAKGPFIALARKSGTSTELSIYDATTATWYDATPVSDPSNWSGVITLTNDIVIGGSGSTAFPPNNSADRPNSQQFYGAWRNFALLDVALTKSQALEIFNGADIATVAGGSGNVRLHVPGVENGALSTNKYGNKASSVTVTLQGNLRPGPTLGRQSTANYLTIDRMAPIIGTLPKSTIATVQLAGAVAGTPTGRLQIRQVGESGKVYMDWCDLLHTTPSAGRWAANGIVVEAPEPCEIQARFSEAQGIVATTGARHYIQPVVVAWGQSEAVLSIWNAQAARRNGTAGPLGVIPRVGANMFSIGALSDSGGAYHLVTAGEWAGYQGDPGTVIANIVGSRAPCGMHVPLQAISGTSMNALMNDADTTRTWDDVLARCQFIANRTPQGEIPVHAHVIIGWEAFSGILNVIANSYIPFLTGMASSGVPQSNINRWLFNGTFSRDAEVIIMPCNRAVNGATATATDASTEADQRGHFRNYAHILGYKIGPEQTTHMMEGEVAAGGLVAAAVTHAETGVWEGNVEMAVNNAEAFLEGIGLGTYPGAVFFESVRAGTASNKVIVRVGDPRPYPGEGLAEAATGYSTAAQRVTEAPGVNLRVKKTGGNAGAGFEARRNGGAYSKANVTDGVIISPREVELTLAWTLAPGDVVDIRYHPGGPGAYSSATITQENWRSGALFWSGETSDLQSLDKIIRKGFAVAGSNQALSFTA